MNKRIHPALAVTSLMLLMLTLSGCWDREELENLALVISLGIDSLPGERVEVTAQIAIPTRLAAAASGGGGGGGEGPPVEVVTKSALSVPEALEAINRVINRRVSLAQNRMIIFGEESARKGLTRYISIITRFREFRRTMQIMVVKGRAKEIMALKPEIEKNPAEYLLDLVRTANYTAETELVMVNDFVRAMEGLGQSPLATYLIPPPKTGNGGPKQVQLGGVAVFRGDRMVGSFPAREVPALRMLTGRFNETFFSLPDPTSAGKRLVLQVTSAQPWITPVLSGERAAVKVRIKAEANLTGSETGKDYMSGGNEGKIEQAAARIIAGQLRRVIERAQREFKADSFGFGNYFRGKVPTWSAWVAFGWTKRFPEVPISVNVKVNLRRYGLQREAPIPHLGE